MPYKFTFDLSQVPKKLFQRLFRSITDFARERGIPEKAQHYAQTLVEKLKLDEITELPLSEIVELVGDLIMAEFENMKYREEFQRSKRRVLLLPHCARKYMDSRCKADFDPSIPTYYCNHCSPDCLVSKAVKLGESRGYDVYIIPGGSCVQKILKRGGYDGVVGVACPAEIKLAAGILEKAGIPGQAIPLTKNGCSGTSFDLNRLEEIL